jgi:hypothetical protein
MTKFQRAYVPKEQIEQQEREMFKRWKEGDPIFLDCFKDAGDNEGAAKILIHKFCDNLATEPFWRNDTYQVSLRQPEDGMVHLSIKRNDRAPIHNWRDLQEIKNQLIGPEHEAVEIYPAESRRVDTANQYHLWVFTDPKYRIPFGFEGRFVTEDSFCGSVQRPL